MALQGVGINNNVILKNVELQSDEKNTSLNFTFTEAEEGKEFNYFDALESGEQIDTGSAGLIIREWAPKINPDDYNGVRKNESQMAEEAGKQMAELTNKLYQFLECFMTRESAGKFAPWTGTGITRDNYNEIVFKDEILKAAFINVGNQFVAKIQPFLNKLDTPLRLLLVRQSAKKHFPQFRKNLILQNPIVELMAIPAEASKLKFTKYELEKKLNDGTPAQQADADPVDTSATTQMDFDAVFDQK